MRPIGIAFEEAFRAEAEALAGRLRAAGSEVVLHGRPRYPIADGMFPFLAGLSQAHAKVYLLIGASTGSAWIAREVSVLQQSAGLTNLVALRLEDCARVP